MAVLTGGTFLSSSVLTPGGGGCGFRLTYHRALDDEMALHMTTAFVKSKLREAMLLRWAGGLGSESNWSCVSLRARPTIVLVTGNTEKKAVAKQVSLKKVKVLTAEVFLRQLQSKYLNPASSGQTQMS